MQSRSFLQFTRADASGIQESSRKKNFSVIEDASPCQVSVKVFSVSEDAATIYIQHNTVQHLSPA